MNKRLLSYLVIVLFRCCAPATAQNLFVKVGATYGVTAADDSKRVSDKYASGADTASTGLYWAWQRWKAEGMPYATFRQTYLGCAIAKDIAWRYEDVKNIKSGYQNTFAFADWTDASGHWYANRTMQIPRGGMLGAGSFGFYDDTTVPDIFATCEFEMTEDWWPANQTERRLFETPNSSLATPDAGSYNESFRIEGFRLKGPAIYGDGITRIAVYVGRGGECCYLNQLFAYQFQYGFVFRGGVPVTFGTLSAFFNEKIGVALMGGWGATFSGQTISGDDNGELFGAHPGYGDEGGGIISFNVGKNEAGIHAEGPGNPYRTHIVAYLEGQYTANIGAAAISRNWITTDAAFVVNPRLTNGTPQASILRVGPHKGFNYRTTLQNLAAGTRWAAPGEYEGRTFTHYAKGDRMYIDEVLTPGTPCNCPPLGFFRGNGTFDYVNCLPARTGTVTPPPSGSWTCTEWGACTNGTQTRTCTCSGTCTTPKPTESQTCQVTPPPTGGMTATAFKADCVEAGSVRPPSAMTDGNLNTFWMGCAAMTANGSQWVLITQPTASVRSGVTFTQPIGYSNSYPRTFTVELSTNGTSFGAPKSFTGTAAKCEATWTAQSVKAIRIKCISAAAGAWWGINEAVVK